MKLWLFILVITMLGFKTNYAQSYGLPDGNIYLFSKYRIPETKLSILNLGGDFNLTTGEGDFEKSSIYGDSFQRNLSTSLYPKYYYLNESDNQLASLLVNPTLKYEKSKNEGTWKESINTKNFAMAVSFNIKNYFNDKSDLYYGLLSEINILMNERENENENEFNHNKSFSGHKNQSYKVGISAGFGRLRNVTPVVSALRLQERMKQLNLITENLSTDDIFSLSQTFARIAHYQSAHERYSKYFWDDLFSSTPSLQQKFNSLNSSASEYLKEVTQELRVIRREGYFVQANLSLDYNNNYSVSDHGFPELRNRQKNITEQFYVKPGVSASYGKQLNMDSQIFLNCSFEGGPNLTKNSIVKQDYDFNINAAYDYELTDRFVTSVALGYLYSITNRYEKETYQSLTGKLSINYFIEDNISVNMNYQYQKRNYDKYAFYGTGSFENNNLSIGFNYFFTKSIIF